MGTVHHPPNANNSKMLNYLTETLSIIEANYFGCGIIILVDFNQLDVRRLNTNFNLKQIVNFPTRGKNTLDLVLTNLDKFYEKPIKMSPFGLSDHVTIVVKPKKRGQDKVVKSIIKSRDMRPSKRYPMLLHIFIVLNRLLFSRIDMRKLMQRHYLMSGGYYF